MAISMNRYHLELAHLFKQFGHELRGLTKSQYKVINAIENCRTNALGGHVVSCNSCEFKKNAYNSCRNRHCPKCQYIPKIKWIEKRKEDLLPCPYFHVVFTIPDSLREIFILNKEVCYNLLFKASSETLKEVAANPKHLGADIGFIGILHTWTQELIDHPHVHYVVPAGGICSKRENWKKGSEKFLLPTKVLAKVFKGKLIDMIKRSYHSKELSLSEDLKTLHMFESFLNDLSFKNWNIYAKKPFAGPEQVINYLGQYTHRIAISNYRLVRLEGDQVTFKVRDKDNPGKSTLKTLKVREFLRRFLLHILPRGFVRIRHFGILGNRYRKRNLSLIREIEKITEIYQSLANLGSDELLKKIFNIDIHQCPKCDKGILTPKAELKTFYNSS